MKLNRQRLAIAAGLRGLTVTELSVLVGRSRTQIYRAWNNPHQHRPTARAIRQHLKGGRV